MALQKQVITLDFGYGGIDQKTDEKRVIPTRFTELTDARFNKIGRLDRRPGHAAVGALSFTFVRLIQNGDQVLAIDSGVTRPNAAHRITTDGSDYQYAAQQGSSSTALICVLPAAEIITKPLSGYPAASSPTGIDRADGKNFYCVVQAGRSYIDIYDKATNNLAKRHFIGMTEARVVAHPLASSITAVQDQFVVGYTQSGLTVKFVTVTASSATLTITGLPDAGCIGGKFDMFVCADATQSLSAMIFVASSQTTAITLRRASWPASDGSGAALGTTAIAASLTVTAVALANSSNNSNTVESVRVFWCESVAGLKTATYNHSLTLVLGPTAVTTTTTTPNAMIGCAFSNSTAHLMVEYAGGSVSENFVRAWSVNSSNTSTFMDDQKGMIIMSKAAAKPGDTYSQFWGAYSATGLNTAFLLSCGNMSATTNQNFGLLGRVLHTTHGGAFSAGTAVPNLQYVDSQFVTATNFLSRNDGSGLLNQNKYGTCSLLHKYTGGWLQHRSQKDTLVSGGYLSVYNGIDGPVSCGPLLFPYITAAPTGAGSMVAGSYAFSGLFEWTDAFGKVYRSTPAAPVTVTLTTTQGVTLSFQNYRIPDLIRGTSISSEPFRFVGYRTLVNESQVYYRCSATAQNVPPSDTTVVTISAADSAISSNEPLYTTGGVFENWLPSAPIALAGNGRRFLAVQGDRPTFIMEGKPYSDRNGTAFFETVGRSIDAGGDRIYALASYLDKWFAFKEASVFAAQGDGADATGQNDTLSEFQPLTNGNGTTQPRSVVTTSIGVVFNSQKGFYLIGADLQPVYIGAAVEDYTSVVVDSSYDEVNDIVYFVLADGTSLVLTIFATESGVETRWSVDTIVAANSVAAIGGVRYFAPTVISGLASSIYKETPGTFIDANVSATAVPALTATTAWTAMGQIQGFGRIWKALCLGTFPPAQLSTTITVQIAYDYSSTWTETHTIASGSMQQNGNNCQFEIRPARQRCEAIRFRLTQGAPASGTAQGLFLNQIQLVVGVKANDNKTPASSRMTKG